MCISEERIKVGNKMTETEIFFDRDRINKVCLMLKYMSLTVPLERIDSLKNSVSCKTAGEILHTILMDSVWMTEKDGNKETPFIRGFIKCKFDYDWNQLFNELTEAFSVLKEKEKISLYESNYTGGYYGEVYQACSTYDYAENKFLYKENEMKKKKENNRVTSGQVQVPQSPEMVLIKEDYHPIKCIIEEVKKRSKIFTRKSDSCR